MRVCVIGNSHAAMLVRALPDPPGGDTVQVFASPGPGPVGFEVSEAGLLTSRDAEVTRKLAAYGLAPDVDLSACDLVVIVAMAGSLFTVQSLLGDHRIHGWPGREETAPLLSEAALEAAVAHRIAGNLAHAYVRAIRAVLPVPIVLVRQPAPSARLLEMRGRYGQIRRVHRRGEGPAMLRLLDAAHRAAFGRIRDVALLDQPDETVAEGFLTAVAYASGAERLKAGVRQPIDDVLHANRVYGALVWQQIRQAAAAFERQAG